MSHTLNDLEDFTVNAADGYIGKVKDFYFDDRTWIICHLVAETGTWLKNRKVLLPAKSIKYVSRESKIITLDISMNQVKNGPSVDKNLIVSPQTEIDYLSYYGYSFYRGVTYQTTTDIPGQDDERQAAETFAVIDAVRRINGDRHLRSCKEIVNYNIEASDSEVGHLQGMLFDEDTWSVQYLIVNTSNWWLGHQVLIEPQVIKDISWGDARIYVDMLRQEVQDAPIFDPDALETYEKNPGEHYHQKNKNAHEKNSSVKHI